MTTTFTENDQAILERFKSSPAYKEVAIQAETEKHAKRAEAIREIVDLRNSAEKEIPKLIKARDAALKKNQEAVAKLKGSGVVVNEANSALHNASVGLKREVGIFEGQLLDSSDPLIQSEIDAWNNEIDRIRNVGATSWEKGTGRFLGKGIGPEVVERHSNKGDIDKAMLDIDVAVKKLEAFKLADQTDLTEKIEIIFKLLPAIGTVNSRWGI